MRAYGGNMKRNIRFIYTSLMCLTLGLTGCSLKADESDPNAWPEKLVVVQMPNENNPNAGAMHDDFRLAMSEYLGIEVQEMEGSDYTVGIEAMASKKIDVMLVSPMSYFQAQKRANAELLVSTPTSEDYRSSFITRADNDEINQLSDLKGKTFAFVDQASSSGYLYPKAKLVKALELESDQLEASGYYFDTVAFSGKHDASVMGILMGDYDAACVAGASIKQMINAGVVSEGDLKVIDQSEIIPNPAYVVRGDLPEDLKSKIKEFYVQYDNETYFKELHGSEKIRFVSVDESDYQPAKELLELLNIDMGDE